MAPARRTGYRILYYKYIFNITIISIVFPIFFHYVVPLLEYCFGMCRPGQNLAHVSGLSAVAMAAATHYTTSSSCVVSRWRERWYVRTQMAVLIILLILDIGTHCNRAPYVQYLLYVLTP